MIGLGWIAGRCARWIAKECGVDKKTAAKIGMATSLVVSVVTLDPFSATEAVTTTTIDVASNAAEAAGSAAEVAGSTC